MSGCESRACSGRPTRDHVAPKGILATQERLQQLGIGARWRAVDGVVRAPAPQNQRRQKQTIKQANKR
jgi:hypothetical protein